MALHVRITLDLGWRFELTPNRFPGGFQGVGFMKSSRAWYLDVFLTVTDCYGRAQQIYWSWATPRG